MRGFIFNLIGLYYRILMGYEHSYPQFRILGVVDVPRYHSINELVKGLCPEEVVLEVLDEV